MSTKHHRSPHPLPLSQRARGDFDLAAKRFSRRGLLRGAGALAVAAALPRGVAVAAEELAAAQRVVTKGRIKQSVCHWCFTKPMDLDTLRPQCGGDGPEVGRAGRPQGLADPQEARPDLRLDQQPRLRRRLQPQGKPRDVHREGQGRDRRLRGGRLSHR